VTLAAALATSVAVETVMPASGQERHSRRHPHTDDVSLPLKRLNERNLSSGKTPAKTEICGYATDITDCP